MNTNLLSSGYPFPSSDARFPRLVYLQNTSPSLTTPCQGGQPDLQSAAPVRLQIHNLGTSRHRSVFQFFTPAKGIIKIPRRITDNAVDPELEIRAFKNPVAHQIFGHFEQLDSVFFQHIFRFVLGGLQCFPDRFTQLRVVNPVTRVRWAPNQSMLTEAQ